MCILNWWGAHNAIGQNLKGIHTHTHQFSIDREGTHWRKDNRPERNWYFFVTSFSSHIRKLHARLLAKLLCRAYVLSRHKIWNHSSSSKIKYTTVRKHVKNDKIRIFNTKTALLWYRSGTKDIHSDAKKKQKKCISWGQ